MDGHTWLTGRRGSAQHKGLINQHNLDAFGTHPFSALLAGPCCTTLCFLVEDYCNRSPWCIHTKPTHDTAPKDTSVLGKDARCEPTVTNTVQASVCRNPEQQKPSMRG
eukprot:774936-Pelagomonas_calceolata.AAC.5